LWTVIIFGVVSILLSLVQTALSAAQYSVALQALELQRANATVGQ
jgi:hypothetical protein